MKRPRLRNAAVALLAALAACGGGAPAPAAPPLNPSEHGEVALVRVYQDDRVTLDGVEVTQAELEQAFAKLSERGGVVWYYREAARGEAPPRASAVIDAIMRADLEVSLSTEEDFSTEVDEDGYPRPRR